RVKRETGVGAALIAAAAFLCATDALVRLPFVGRLEPASIVFSEHLIIVAAMLPWILCCKLKELFERKSQHCAALALIGAGGSAVATVLFPESFRYVTPSVSTLLQTIQPVLVVAL